MGSPVNQSRDSSKSGRRNVWVPTPGLQTLGDLVGAARAIALTGERQPGTLRGSDTTIVLRRTIEGVEYQADPTGHAVQVTRDGALVLARWRDAASRMVHFARSGYRRLVDRHYRLTHLLQTGQVWIGRHQSGEENAALVVIEGVEGGTVRLVQAATGKPSTTGTERFDGRMDGYQPATEIQTRMAAVLLAKAGPAKPE